MGIKENCYDKCALLIETLALPLLPHDSKNDRSSMLSGPSAFVPNAGVRVAAGGAATGGRTPAGEPFGAEGGGEMPLKPRSG